MFASIHKGIFQALVNRPCNIKHAANYASMSFYMQSIYVRAGFHEGSLPRLNNCQRNHHHQSMSQRALLVQSTSNLCAGRFPHQWVQHVWGDSHHHVHIVLRLGLKRGANTTLPP